MPQSSSQEKRLEFIVTTNPAATKDATIRAARSHVKREFFRQKRLRDVQNFANQQSSSNSSSGATSSRTACPEGQSGSNRCSNEFKPASRDLNVGPYHPSDHLLLDDTPDVKVEESSEQNLIPTIWRESTTGALPLRSGTGSRSSPNYGLSYTIYDQEQPYSHPGSRASADSDVSVDDDFTIPDYFSEVQQLRASGCKISLQSPLQGWAQAFNFNEALFHASSLATYGALTYGKLEDLEASSTTMVALFHRGAAIRAVNAALDDPKARFSDENIAAIISLASVEVGRLLVTSRHAGY
ncbi:MAG: hypothetical protein M1834_005226 [Cirrosporium novae-zelandiae]|nr:MAG: hypothetical protein M1834_005226 [Cirrosporium novae-zelandiae]